MPSTAGVVVSTRGLRWNAWRRPGTEAGSLASRLEKSSELRQVCVRMGVELTNRESPPDGASVPRPRSIREQRQRVREPCLSRRRQVWQRDVEEPLRHR